MKNKGFTLVELLAVIVIIGLIGIITVPIIDGVIKNGREKTRNTNYDTILNAAYDFVQEHPDRLPLSSSSPSTEILFNELVSEGLLKNDMKDPDTKTSYPMSSKVTIKYYDNFDSLNNETANNAKFYGNYLFTYIK